MGTTIARLLTILALTTGVAGVPARARGEEQAVHYVVLAILPDGSVRPVFSTPVVVDRDPAPQRPATPARAGRDRTAMALQLRDAAGALVFEETQLLPTWLRSETPGAPLGDGTHTIDAHWIPVPTRAFVARLPIVPDGHLSLRSELLSRAAELRVEVPAASVAGATPPDVTRLVENGPPGNRLDLLITGDGYSAAERAKFQSDAAVIAAGFFDVTPLREYRNYANVATLFVPSPQSGADQPGYDAGCTEYQRAQTCCADSTAFGALTATADTAFDATFCSFNVQRALTVDDAKVFMAAAAVPDWDMIIVLVNSSTYGGTGGPLSTVSISGFETTVAQHEYGHSFGLLADEYSDPFPGYPACSDVDTTIAACEPNVTDRTNRAAIKWRRWIAAAQPIPSVEPPAVATAAGLWEGARYLGTGLYRQGFACMMQLNGAPFCDVASEALTLRFYQGGWGTPATGIDNIEPGSESPPAGAVTLPESGGSFAATLLGPGEGPALETQWYVDGVLAASAPAVNGARVSFTLASAPGPHTLELHVTDLSPILHESVRRDFTSRRAWSVTIGPGGTPVCGDADASGSVTVTDGVQTLRAAAALPSVCSLSRCDVDGSGSVSVTDGVNVLRAAAGLPVSAICPAD